MERLSNWVRQEIKKPPRNLGEKTKGKVEGAKNFSLKLLLAVIVCN